MPPTFGSESLPFVFSSRLFEKSNITACKKHLKESKKSKF